MINGYFIWDKQSKINGASAQKVLDSDIMFRDNTVVFFTRNNTAVQHGFIEKIRNELNMEGCTNEEVCNAKLDMIIAEEAKHQADQITLEEQATKMSLLQEENNRMKEALKLLLTEEQIKQLNL